MKTLKLLILMTGVVILSGCHHGLMSETQDGELRYYPHPKAKYRLPAPKPNFKNY